MTSETDAAAKDKENIAASAKDKENVAASIKDEENRAIAAKDKENLAAAATEYKTAAGSSSEDLSFRLKAGAFLATAAGIGMLGGFGTAVAATKRQDPHHFDAGMVGIDAASTKAVQNTKYLQESGAALATRALGYGTLYAFAGCGLLFFSVWKLAGASSLAEFREKVGAALPRIPRNSPPQGRTEFSGLNDLMQYLVDRSVQETEDKAAARAARSA